MIPRGLPDTSEGGDIRVGKHKNSSWLSPLYELIIFNTKYIAAVQRLPVSITGKCENISMSQANFTRNLYIQVCDNLLVISGDIEYSL